MVSTVDPADHGSYTLTTGKAHELRNHIVDCADLDVGRRYSNLATQPQLGLHPQRWIGLGCDGDHRAAALGSTVIADASPFI